MKTLLLTLFLFIISLQVYSQDIIIRHDGFSIEAKILEITDETVKFKRFSNLTGPTRHILKIDVKEIVYENGVKETFEEQIILSENTENAARKKKETGYFRNGLYFDAMIGYGESKRTNEYPPISYYDAYSNYIPGGESDPKKDRFNHGSISFRFGNKWFLGKNSKYRPGLIMQWARLGFYADKNQQYTSYSLAPLNLGIANSFKFNEKSGMEANLTAGLSLINFLTSLTPSENVGMVGYNVGFELKYNYDIFSVGLDFSNLNTGFNEKYRTHKINVLSLTLGLRI